MAWMSPNMKMETIGGGIGKVFGRAMSGDTLFQNIYTAEGSGGMISIASSFPGSIKAFEITPGNTMIMQKSAFLAAQSGVELSVHFQKNWVPAFLAERDLLCRKYPAAELHLLSLTDMWSNMNWRRVSRL